MSNNSRLELTGCVSAEAVDRELLANERLLKGDSLEIDLARADSATIDGIFATLSAINLRNDDNKPGTLVHLPASGPLREFLQFWGFDKELNRSQRPASDEECGAETSIDPTKIEYRGRRLVSEGAPIGPLFRADEGNSSLLALRSVPVGPRPEDAALSPRDVAIAMATRESNRWRERWVYEILKRYLPENTPTIIAERIVYEAISNGVRHANAGELMYAAVFVEPVGDQEGRLEFAFWDNGQSIIETLRKAITDCPGCFRNTESAFQQEYLVCSANGFLSEIRSSASVDAGWPDDKVLLASMFPGVTSTSDMLPGCEEFSSIAGMGLAIFLNAAVALLKGEVTIRSGRCLLRSEKIDKDRRYEVHLKSGLPPFSGNLLWVSVPLSLPEPPLP